MMKESHALWKEKLPSFNTSFSSKHPFGMSIFLREVEVVGLRKFEIDSLYRERKMSIVRSMFTLSLCIREVKVFFRRRSMIYESEERESKVK